MLGPAKKTAYVGSAWFGKGAQQSGLGHVCRASVPRSEEADWNGPAVNLG